jgi:hypothetical protein
MTRNYHCKCLRQCDGGANAADQNVITGSIIIDGTSSTGNYILGNYIERRRHRSQFDRCRYDYTPEWSQPEFIGTSATPNVHFRYLSVGLKCSALEVNGNSVTNNLNGVDLTGNQHMDQGLIGIFIEDGPKYNEIKGNVIGFMGRRRNNA